MTSSNRVSSGLDRRPTSDRSGSGIPSFSGPSASNASHVNSHTSGAQPVIPDWQGASLAGTSSSPALPLKASVTDLASGKATIVEDATNDDDMCVICLSAPATAGFLHGSTVHKCCCGECAADMSSQSLCPICREPIQHVILKIY